MTIGAGTIYGSLNRGTSRGPGERVIWTYTGALADGEFVYTYLSGIDFYVVDPLVDDSIYTANVDSFAGPVPTTNYAPIYFQLYDVLNQAEVAAADAVKCNVLVIGDSA